MRFSSPQDVADEFVRRDLPERFCHMPFSTLLLEPDGHVGGCRLKGTEFEVGNLKTHTLDEIRGNGYSVLGDVTGRVGSVAVPLRHGEVAYASLGMRYPLSAVEPAVVRSSCVSRLQSLASVIGENLRSLPATPGEARS